MNKLAIIITLTSLFLVNTAQAGATPGTGYALLENCASLKRVGHNKNGSTTEFLEAGLCQGFIHGISSLGTNFDMFCYPNPTTLSQKIDVVLDFLKRNKKWLGSTDGALVHKALTESFPCKKS